MKQLSLLLLCVCLIITTQAHANHSLSLFGDAKYPANFSHFDYVNPDAPKGGTVKMAYPFAFDSLNPFTLKGIAAPAITLLYDTLMTPSLDEAQTYYPLVATSVKLADDKRSITFTLDARARFHDGSRVTAEDIAFSFNTLKEKGHPAYKLRFKEIDRAEILTTTTIRFHFTTDTNRELPFMLASLPVLSKAFYAKHDFDDSAHVTPLTSGAYTVKAIDTGRSITYKRVEDYWAKDLPTRKGYYNFDEIRYDVYRDETVAMEAFKAGAYDMREEYVARRWAKSYDFPAVKAGDVIIDETPHKIPRGMQAFIFNVRKAKFADRRVREAIGLTFDFEWMNRTLFYDAYSRNTSFFQNTPFAATELPSEEEQALLAPFRETLPPAIYTDIYAPPVSDASGFIRAQLIRADKLLKEAGWIIKDGVRVHQATGEPLTIEFLSRQASLQRLVLAMKRNLLILGIKATFRNVDESQYQMRMQTFDYDITSVWWNMNLHFPGNEQKGYWHCSQADIEGGQNMSGYCSEAVDHIVERITNASSYDALLHAAHALDRILLHEHIVIPHFSIFNFRMAYWDIFGIPDTRPAYDRGFDTWWMKEKPQE